MRDELARTAEVVVQLRREITEGAAPFHAFDVINATWMSTGLVRPGTLQSYHPEASTATAEYVAHVLLDRASPEPLREATREDISHGVPVESMANAVGQILQRLPAFFALRQGRSQDLHDPYLELRTYVYAHNLTIRSFAFEWQEQETVTDLFAPFAKELRTQLAFTAKEGIELATALGTLQLERIEALAEVAWDGAQKMKARLRRLKSGRIAPDDDPYVAQLLSWPQKRAERWLDHTAMLFMAAHMGRSAAFTPAELADAAGVTEGAAEGFLSAFSVDFNARADRDLWQTDPDSAVGGEMEVMRRRPIVHDGHGRYLPAAIDSVVYGLRDVLTDALKGGAAWQRFDRHRARVLEGRALDALASALGADWFHSGVKYWYRDEAGDLAEGEVDGILRADTVVVLLEAKAGSMHATARRGAPQRLERNLRDLIVSAHDQLQRAERMLVEGVAERVTDASGHLLALELSGVTRIMHVAVSLEDLSAVALAVWQLGDVGLLPPEDEAPWAVGIHELELICSLVEFPAQLLHYVLRRRRTYRQRVWAMDEMDMWMRYLSHGLWWEDDDLADRMLQVASHTDALDAWAYGERGLRPKARRPRQKLDRQSRALLDSIGATGAEGRIEAQLMLLEMSGEASRKVVAELKKSIGRSRRDGEVHRSTFVFSDDMAVTVEGGPPPPGRGRLDGLAERGVDAIDEYGVRRWLGLSGTVGSQRLLTGMVVLTNPERLRQP